MVLADFRSEVLDFMSFMQLRSQVGKSGVSVGGKD